MSAERLVCASHSLSRENGLSLDLSPLRSAPIPLIRQLSVVEGFESTSFCLLFVYRSRHNINKISQFYTGKKNFAQTNTMHFRPLIPLIPLLTTQAAALGSWGFIDNPSGTPSLIGSYFGIPLQNKIYDF